MIQGNLIKKASRSSQPTTHDMTDLSTLRYWLNFPWGKSMEYEIYKANNTIQVFVKVRLDYILSKFPIYLLTATFGVDCESHASSISLIYFP